MFLSSAITFYPRLADNHLGKRITNLQNALEQFLCQTGILRSTIPCLYSSVAPRLDCSVTLQPDLMAFDILCFRRYRLSPLALRGLLAW